MVAKIWLEGKSERVFCSPTKNAEAATGGGDNEIEHTVSLSAFADTRLSPSAVNNVASCAFSRSFADIFVYSL